DALQRHSATADDLDGIVEYPRSIAGVRLALLFRQLASGNVKVSFRSVGDVDVAELACRFGGGGHRKAAGASLEGTLAEVLGRVRVSSAERGLLPVVSAVDALGRSAAGGPSAARRNRHFACGIRRRDLPLVSSGGARVG